MIIKCNGRPDDSESSTTFASTTTNPVPTTTLSPIKCYEWPVQPNIEKKNQKSGYISYRWEKESKAKTFSDFTESNPENCANVTYIDM